MESPVYEAIVNDEPQAYIDILQTPSVMDVVAEYDSLDELSDNEDGFYGYTKCDTSLMLSLNRNMDLTTFSRYSTSFCQPNWHPKQSVTINRKRNHPASLKRVYNNITDNIETTSPGVPKRRRRQKSNQAQ